MVCGARRTLRGAHGLKSFAVIDQQADVELDAGQLGHGQPLDALAQRRARDGQRVDAIGLAAIAAGAPLVGHQPGGHANDALAETNKNRSNAPETWRQSSSAQTRSAPRPRAQSSAARKPRSPTSMVLSPNN
jgi:hypothetical protein